MQNTLMLCANCGFERDGPFCSRCGQNDRDYQRALPPVLGDLLREAFEVDSRLLRTLQKLLLKPGELAVEFSRNRRASYVSPIRLYLFVSIGFFFLLSVTTDIGPEPGERPQVTAELEAVADTDTGRLLTQLGEEQRQQVTEILDRPDSSIARLLLLQLADSVSENAQDLEPVEVYFIGQLIEALYEPTSVVDQLMDNLPIAIFIMLPIYALLLKLFYFGAHRFYVENLVFAIHLHTFAFLVFTVLLVIPEDTGIEWLESAIDLFSTLLTLWLAAYHFLALKRYFGGSNFGTLLKFGGLMMLYTLMLTPAAFLIVLVITVVTV